MVFLAAVVAIVLVIAAAVVISSIPSQKSADPAAITLSEFGIPIISQAQTKRVLMGNKWVTDPLVADYGNYAAAPIWHNP